MAQITEDYVSYETAKTWCEGFDAHKEQILKDTIEVTVQSPILGPPMVCCIANGCSDGDRVRVVILKEATE